MYQQQAKRYQNNKISSNYKWKHDKFDELYTFNKNEERKIQQKSLNNQRFQTASYQHYQQNQFKKERVQETNYITMKVYEQKQVQSSNSNPNINIEKQIPQMIDLRKENDDEQLSTVSTSFSEILKTPSEDNYLLQVKLNLPTGIQMFKIYKFADFAQTMYDIKTTLKLSDQQVLALKLILLKKLQMDEQWKVDRLNIQKPMKLLQIIQEDLIITSKAFFYTNQEIKNQNCQDQEQQQ